MAELAQAQEVAPPNGTGGARARNRAFVQQLYDQHQRQYGEDSDMLVRPGLLASRKERWVSVWAEAVGLPPSDPVEFFLIAEDSGKDYEALAISFARPLDIHRALEFIGLHPGEPVDYERFRFWPKAERVFITFTWQDTEGRTRSAAAEELVVDTRTGRPLPVMGLAFTGSRWVDAGDGSTQKLYAAEHFDPLAIASDYNEPLCVLDVPRRAVDGEMYGFQKPNPKLLLPTGALITIRLEPEYKDGRVRVTNLRLRVDPRPATTGDTPADMRFSLSSLSGEPVAQGDRLKHVLAAFGRLTRDGRDPFVTVEPGPDLSLRGVSALYAMLSSLATDEGIRIEPPPAGHLCYRAFLPDPNLRDRANRPTQPCELHLYLTEAGPTGTLVRITEIWKPQEDLPELEIVPQPIPDAEALEHAVRDRPPELPVLLVFAPGELTYGALMEFLRPVLPDFPTTYVFPAPAAPAPTATAPGTSQ